MSDERTGKIFSGLIMLSFGTVNLARASESSWLEISGLVLILMGAAMTAWVICERA